MMIIILKRLAPYLLIPATLVLLALSRQASARNSEETPETIEDQYKLAAKELQRWFKPADKEPDFKETPPRPTLGLWLDNVTFKDAYELNYRNNYGVLVDGTKLDSVEPSLSRNDIIIEMDGMKVRHLSQLEKLIDEKQIGDSVAVRYYRDGNVFTKRLGIYADDFFSTDWRPSISRDLLLKSKGLGGGSYRPIYINLDNEPLNALFSSLGLSEMSAQGAIYHGFELQGLIKNGFFIGGLGVWSGTSRQDDINISDDVTVTRSLKYRTGLGGFTLDKRFRPADKWIFALGGMVGWGNTRFEIHQTEANIDWEELEDYTTGTYNDYFELKKKYLLLQPRASLMYRVLPVFWIKVEAGYQLSYSRKGWQSILNENEYEIVAPANDTSLNGFTLTISPWFGF